MAAQLNLKMVQQLQEVGDGKNNKVHQEILKCMISTHHILNKVHLHYMITEVELRTKFFIKHLIVYEMYMCKVYTCINQSNIITFTVKDCTCLVVIIESHNIILFIRLTILLTCYIFGTT